MKRVLLLVGFIVFVVQLQARVMYVMPGGSGNGSSWHDAFGDLQMALQTAKFGDRIWVSAGKYLPTRGIDRNISFVIPEGVEIYGGFAGMETSLDQRNLQSNPTILSGEIGSSSIDDNSFTVVYTRNVSHATVVDGFIITGGVSNGIGSRGSIQRCGAGWFNDGADGSSSPIIRNCIFKNNYARDGAGLYNFAINGVCNPIIRNCQFESNRADLDGGAIYNDGNDGVCSPRISSCVFKYNEAAYGAAVLNRADYGKSEPQIKDCFFKGNIAYIRGSSVYNNRQEKGICNSFIENCRFEGNKSSVGREISSTVNNMLKEDERPKGGIVYRSNR